MGKRKKSSRGPGPKKKREPLGTSFKCLFCSNETSVSATIDKKNMIGTLHCKACGQHFQSVSRMGKLMQPVDIYFEWIDACEEVADKKAAEARPQPTSAYRPAQPAAAKSRAGLVPGEKYTDEDAGFIDDDDVDAEADYADE